MDMPADASAPRWRFRYYPGLFIISEKNHLVEISQR
jgi:hypothetical protein